MTTEVMQGEQKSWAETPPMHPLLRHAIGDLVEQQTWLDRLAAPAHTHIKNRWDGHKSPAQKPWGRWIC